MLQSAKSASKSADYKDKMDLPLADLVMAPSATGTGGLLPLPTRARLRPASSHWHSLLNLSRMQ